jgi:hypothetical protein
LKKVVFNPPFKEQLFFVHLNQKQDSRKAIANYKAIKNFQKLNFNLLNTLTEDILKSCELEDFENLITKHELLIAKLTQQTPLKTSHFPDYKGAIKSLGGLGWRFFISDWLRSSLF